MILQSVHIVLRLENFQKAALQSRKLAEVDCTIATKAYEVINTFQTQEESTSRRYHSARIPKFYSPQIDNTFK